MRVCAGIQSVSRPLVLAVAALFCTPGFCSAWQYSPLKDSATQQVMAVDDAAVSLSLMVSRANTAGAEVVFKLGNDTLDCASDHCEMNVQFDVGTEKTIEIAPMAAGDAFRPVRSAAFAGVLAEAKVLSIELGLKSRGVVRFRLNVADLQFPRQINPPFVFAGMKLGGSVVEMPEAFQADQLSPALNCRKARGLRGVIPGQDNISARVCLFAGSFYQVAIESNSLDEYRAIAAYISHFYGGTGFDAAYPAVLTDAGDVTRQTSHAEFWRKNNSPFAGYFYLTDDVIDFLVPKNLKLTRSVKKPTR